MPPKVFIPKHKRKAAAAAKEEGGDSPMGTPTSAATPTAASVGASAPALTGKHAEAAAARTATGLLVSEKRSRDVKIGAFSLALHSNILVEDTEIELTWGSRYGLIGRNGCGKSSLLQCLANREVPIPAHLDTFLLAEEAPPTELSALEFVVDSATKEVARLEALQESLLEEYGPDSEALEEVHTRLDTLDPSTFVSRASAILVGLGFNSTTLHKLTKDMSGGWRMRVALAHALFISPSILLLDEPTNHLDLDACVWLEDYLSRYPCILVMVSHSQDMLNGVCTDTMVMQNRKLRYWGGNFDQYTKTRAEQDANQLKLYEKQQEEIAHIKAFISSCGTYANLVRQAKSRQKILDKMIDDGLIEMPYSDPVFRFEFPKTGQVAPPIISFSDVAFSYSGKKEDYLFSDLSFGIDSDSRISLVGPNGAGKSTLLKLMVGENAPCEGSVSIKAGVSIGRYHQHSAEVLDNDLTPIEYISRKFSDRYPDRGLEQWRSAVGLWGIPSDKHLVPIRYLSDGLKTRLVFCEIAMRQPHILLLDEPTNAADMEMIDSMADAIKKFEGGVLLISHDFRLLSQVAEEIWVVDNGVKKWAGDIRSYKAHLAKKVLNKAADATSTTKAAGGSGAKAAAGGSGKAAAGAGAGKR